MVTEYDEFTVKKISRILKFLERKYGLEGVALITIEGNRIASAESSVVNMDEFSGNAVVITQAADKLLQRMGNGNIDGVILRGKEGFIVIERVTDTVFLIASDKRSYKMGYTTNLLRKFAVRVAGYLAKGKKLEVKPAQPAKPAAVKPRFIIKRPTPRPMTEVMRSAKLPTPRPVAVQPQTSSPASSPKSASPTIAPTQATTPGADEVTVIDAGTLVLEDLAASGNVEVGSNETDPTTQEIMKELEEIGVNPEELEKIDQFVDESV